MCVSKAKMVKNISLVINTWKVHVRCSRWLDGLLHHLVHIFRKVIIFSKGERQGLSCAFQSSEGFHFHIFLALVYHGQQHKDQLILKVLLSDPQSQRGVSEKSDSDSLHIFSNKTEDQYYSAPTLSQYRKVWDCRYIMWDCECILKTLKQQITALWACKQTLLCWREQIVSSKM